MGVGWGGDTNLAGLELEVLGGRRQGQELWVAIGYKGGLSNLATLPKASLSPLSQASLFLALGYTLDHDRSLAWVHRRRHPSAGNAGGGDGSASG